MNDVKLGLALGAGGAKGLAHIGFLEVLSENNIKADFVSGSSMGSFIGSLYACEINFELVKERIDTFKMRNIVDFDILFFKRLSISRGKRIEFLLKSLLRDLTFEDCKIPFACTAVDLISGKGVALNSGSLCTAVLASCCIPSAFPPVKYNDMLLVDGGIYDRIPTKLCYEMGAEIVIGVDVVGKPIALAEDPKNIFQVVSRTFDLMDYNLTINKKNKSDLMITITQDDVDSLGVKNLRASYEAGRRAGEENLEKIKEVLNKK